MEVCSIRPIFAYLEPPQNYKQQNNVDYWVARSPTMKKKPDQNSYFHVTS